MIRQAINCDMCGAEKLESASHWFVADERHGELRLRAWGASKGTKKNMKHVCGQKCVQRLMDNFTASILAEIHAGKNGKEVLSSENQEHTLAAIESHDEKPILERMGYDRETAALIEAESWAGPVRPKGAPSWGANRSTPETFLPAAHTNKMPTVKPFQRMA